MKYVLSTLLFISFQMIFISCASSENTSRDSTTVRNSDVDFSNFRNLSDALRRQPGVRIDGVGDDIVIQIRGASSFGADARPLFVVDGVVMGHSYGVVNSSISMVDVSSIRVLTGSEASAYGIRGANGVIEITLKN